VTGLQWLLKGFLERKLLGLISEAMVKENQNQRLFSWTQIPLFRDLDASLERWETSASQREVREQHAVRTLQVAWGVRRRRRKLLAARLVSITVGARVQAAAVARASQPKPKAQEDGILMATIEEMAKRIDYLESVIEEQRARIAELERELTSWPIEYEDDVSKKLFFDSV
jgi:hypothetical protein